MSSEDVYVFLSSAEQVSICVYKAYTFLFYFFKWPIVSLDKTLIHRLVYFIALWSCT